MPNGEFVVCLYSGYAVISLANAVQAFKRGPLETAHFKVPLTHRGLPAGTLEGGMKLTWERNVVRRGMSITSSLIGKTMSFKESIKKRVLLVKTWRSTKQMAVSAFVGHSNKLQSMRRPGILRNWNLWHHFVSNLYLKSMKFGIFGSLCHSFVWCCVKFEIPGHIKEGYICMIVLLLLLMPI